MKKIWKLMSMAFLAAVVGGTFVSCDDDDDAPKSYEMKVVLNLQDGMTIENLSDLTVVMTSDKGLTDTLHMNEATTTVTALQGQYKLNATGKVKDEAAAYAIGQASVDLFGNATVTVDVEKTIQSPLIFKAIYSTGGKQGYVVDQYFEIVNNSDEVQYLDQLILTAPMGNQTKPNAWQANDMKDIYECGQGTVLAFPGSGKDYPLNPGQSIVLANNAVDHAPLAGEGSACPDLSKADWEVYLDNVKGDIDYEAPNVEIIFQNNTFMKAFGLGFFGRGYVLARCPQGMTPQQFAADKKNIMTTPGTSSKTEFLMVPSKYVLDAVDIWDGSKTEHYSTFLPKDDAQGIAASETWKGKSIRRKVTKVENGRAYYQDTNNSANDFLNNQPLTPGVTPTVAD